MSKDKIATYEEVLALKDQKDIVLIDVREPSEVQETGKIPTSINIPLGEVKDAFENLSEEFFLTKYKTQVPKKDTEIIIYCRSGRRSQMAMDAILELGFKNARNYKGSWLEWESKLNA